MWPFSRRQKDLDLLPPVSSENHAWGIAQTTFDDAPLIIRFNSSAKEWVGHKALAIKLGFAVPLNSPHVGGLPDPEENARFADIEDIILREVEARARGVHALVLTTGVMKEFVFYIMDDADIAAMHNAIRSAVTTHEVQCMAVREPAWDSYREFTGG